MISQFDGNRRKAQGAADVQGRLYRPENPGLLGLFGLQFTVGIEPFLKTQHITAFNFYNDYTHSTTDTKARSYRAYIRRNNANAIVLVKLYSHTAKP
jgi:hypothetical protein